MKLTRLGVSRGMTPALLRRMILGALLTTTAGFSGCASHTQVLNQWRAEPGARAASYNYLFVVSLAQDEATRRKVEKQLTENLHQRGVEAIASSDYVSHTAGEDRKAWQEKLRRAALQAGSQAALVVSLVRREESNRYQPAQTAALPVPNTPYYGNFGTYWLNQYDQVYAASELVTEQRYFVESSLYDLQTDAPVWVAQTETQADQDVDAAAEDFAHTLVNALKDSGVLSPGP